MLRVEPTSIRIRRWSLLRWAALGWARVLTAAVVVSSAAATVAALHIAEDALFAVCALAGLAALIAVVAALPLAIFAAMQTLRALLAKDRRGAIELADGELTLTTGRRSLSYPFAEVRAVESDSATSAVLEMEDGDRVYLATSSARELASILETIASPEPGRVWTLNLHRRPPFATSFHIFLASAGALGLAIAPATGGVIGLTTSVCAMAAALWMTVLRSDRPTGTIDIGPDGVAIRSRSLARFVPFAEVAEARTDPRGARLVIDADDAVELRITPAPLTLTATAFAARRQAALLRRIEEGRASVEAPLVGEERLLRNGRSLEAWRDGLRDLVRGDAGGYRTALLPVEEAARVVESPHVAPEARIGAALALSALADPALKQRLRVATGKLADETTRFALVEALDDDLDPSDVERMPSPSGRARRG